MGQLTRRSSTVIGIVRTAVAFGLLAACAVGTRDTEVSQAPQAAARQAACQPKVDLLPTRTTTNASAATAMSDNGWIVGWLTDLSGPSEAVLWRNNGPPLGLGTRGVPVDINDAGAIAINHIQGGLHTAGLWKDGTLRTLRGTRARPRVNVTALNDHGAAVGSIWGSRATGRAAVWRHGKLRVLRNPSSGRTGYFASDINNSGLIVGGSVRDPFERVAGRGLWWRPGDGRGVIPNVSSGRATGAKHVDNRGRLVGFLAPRQEDGPIGAAVKWRSIQSQPVKYRGWGTINALHADTGYMVGATREGWWASIGRIADMRSTRLPNPATLLDEPDEYTETSLPTWEALDVATGLSPYAPEGGVTVVGSALHTESLYDGGGKAVLWTCAQNYR
jgi:hypothetical protein